MPRAESYQQDIHKGGFWPKNLLPFSAPTGLNSAVFSKMDNLIEARELQIERKHFHVEFRENDRGKFLRITEEANLADTPVWIADDLVNEF